MSETHLGKYRILQLLAVGGMGEVFLARHEGPAGFAKTAVVKRILAHLAREPGFVEMFLDEARLAAVLSHPNVVQIFELGEDEGAWFIAMEFLHGRSVRALQKAAAKKGEDVRPAQAARILAQALTGLHYAHTAVGAKGETLNIVHRDMSPDNVMVGFNGVVKVLDFGIAKAATAITTTRTGTVKGKYGYMAPEQLLAEKVDGRTDVYSVGVMLYELLSGSRPFSAPTEAALVNLILNSPVPPLEEMAPDVPAELCATVMKALSKDRAARWATAEEFATALEGFVHRSGEPAGNAATAAYMKEVFGAAALENPSVLTPSATHVLPSIDVSMKTEAQRAVVVALPPPPRSRTWLFVLAAVATLATVGLLGVALGSGLTPPPPAEVPKPIARVEPLPVEPPEPRPFPPPVEPVPPPKKLAAGKGLLDLRVNPWGEIFEGEKSLGITPMKPIELSAGVHRLVVKNIELKVSRQVTAKVPRNGSVTIRVDLLD